MTRYTSVLRAAAVASLVGLLAVACAQNPAAGSFGSSNVPGARANLVPAEAVCC